MNSPIEPPGLEILSKYNCKNLKNGVLYIVEADEISFEDKQRLHFKGWKNIGNQWVMNMVQIHMINNEVKNELFESIYGHRESGDPTKYIEDLHKDSGRTIEERIHP